jgi:hypothetical protein
MSRTATDATKAQIAALGNSNGHPPWLRAAMHDAATGRPMSLERERRVCAALGIDPPAPRRRYCRLCLPVTLTQEQRAQVREFALILTEAIP